MGGERGSPKNQLLRCVGKSVLYQWGQCELRSLLYLAPCVNQHETAQIFSRSLPKVSLYPTQNYFLLKIHHGPEPLPPPSPRCKPAKARYNIITGQRSDANIRDQQRFYAERSRSQERGANASVQAGESSVILYTNRHL